MVVANGIPLPQSFSKERNPVTPVRFLFAARHTVEKGCEVLIQAIRQLPVNAAYEVWIAGKGEMEPKFQALAQENPRVKLLGYISGRQKQDIFRDADCMILPSLWYENAPVVIVEAAAYGMGIIGSRIGAIPEFIEHEKTGLLFEPGNANHLAQTMLRVIQQPDLLEGFAAQGKTLVEASSVDTMVDHYLAQYEYLLNTLC